jgi:ribosomal-protein-alanine N-acetyltransferase
LPALVPLRYPEPPLSDGVVALRPWRLRDIHYVAEVSRDPEIPLITTVPALYSNEAAVAWIERQWRRLERGEGLSLAIATAETDEAVGAATLMRRESPSRAGLGYVVAPHARGRGLAVRAVNLLVPWALQSGFDIVEAMVEPANGASLRVLERVGLFALVRRDERGIDKGGRRVPALVFEARRPFEAPAAR